jgi:hypothetical protein
LCRNIAGQVPGAAIEGGPAFGEVSQGIESREEIIGESGRLA